jgi:hypothetical protein
MMYFFVFSPPKTTVAVSPAFCAASVKCTTGLAFAFSELPALPVEELADCIENHAQSPKKQRSRRKENWSIING